jgi:intracellular septation protein A
MNKKENSFSSILFNILIPVLILNKGHKYGLPPHYGVLIALSFPLFFTLKTWIQSQKINFVSLLGLLNVVVSGTLTLLALGGMWFAVKEAAFPLLIGAFVLGSSWTQKPFFQTLFMNPSTFDTAKVDSKLETQEKKLQFLKLMKKATVFLSISFLMSAALNFILAIQIFTPFAENLSDLQKQEILNEQLSRMTLYSLVVILVPSMIFLGTLLFYTFKKINEITGLTTDDLLLKS